MMFARPAALLLLLLIPLLILLDRLRRRPLERVVGSLSLWLDPAGESARRRTPNRRLETWLRVAAVALFAIGAAGPQRVDVAAAPPTVLHVLIDRTPSMGAGDRMNDAIAMVRRAAAGLDDVRIRYFPPTRRGVIRDVDDLGRPGTALAAASIQDRLRELGHLVETPGARALFVSDHLAVEVDPPENVAIGLVGDPLPNACFVAASIDDDGLFLAWKNFGSEDDSLSLTSPGGFDGIPSSGHRIFAPTPLGTFSLTRSSDGLDDDSVFEVVAGRARGPISVRGDAPRAVELAVSLLANGTTRDGNTAPGVAWRVVPPKLGGWIAVLPPEPVDGIVVEPAAAPGVRSADAIGGEKPLVDPFILDRGARVHVTHRLRLPDGAVPLLRLEDAEHRDVLAARSPGGAIVLAFDPTSVEDGANLATRDAHAVLWKRLVDAASPDDGARIVGGLFDAQESDLTRAERREPVFPEPDAPVPTRVPFHAPFALAAVAALAWLLVRFVGGRG